MYCLEWLKFDTSINTYYVEVENVAFLRDVVLSWKMILGGHGKSWKSDGEFFREKGWEPWSSSLITRQTLADVCHTVHVGISRTQKIWGAWAPLPLNRNRALHC